MTDTNDASDDPTVRVRLVGLPLPLLVKGQEHSEDLRREFALIAASDSDSVPARLLEVADRSREAYAGALVAPQNQIERALAAGESAADVEYVVPASVRDAAAELAALYEEADEFCRNGDMLTLATPPESAKLRRWFLGEFIRQIDGKPPTPWTEYNDEAAD